MLRMAKLPKSFWAEAVQTTWYLINRSPSIPLNFVIPKEVWSRRKVSYSHLRVFGCKTFAHISKENRQKLDDKSTPCIFVGYSNAVFGYKLWDPTNKKMFRSRDIVFQKDQIVADFEKSAKCRDVITPDLFPSPRPSQNARCDDMQSCRILYHKLRTRRKEMKTWMKRVLSRGSNPLN